MKSSTCLVALLLLGPLADARAQQPRLGRIDFPSSGRVEAQPYFLRGVLYLHSFEYDSAAKHFRVAQRLDPNFALAFWGEAMTYNHPVWMQQDSVAARAVLARLAPTRALRRAKALLQREKRLLDAIETLYGDGGKEHRDSLYAHDMERLAQDFPGDHEVRTFYALSLLGLSHTGRHVPTYMRAAAIVEEIFRENPEHPGALHYLIHAYDDPVHAPLGLRAARAYADVAPGAAHAQHMTSHIFLAMGMWDDVERANLAAWESTNRRNGHYTHWLSYGYLQRGQVAESERYVESIVRDATRDPTPYKIGYRNLMLAGYLVDTENWSGSWGKYAIDSVRQSMRAPSAPQMEFARGLAALATGRRAIAGGALDSLYASVRSGRVAAATHHQAWLGAVEIMAEMLRAAQLASASLLDSAIVVARLAARLEETLPFEFGPPETIKPPNELLGELLARAERPAEARLAFEQGLARTPNRARSVLGLARASAAMGDSLVAHKYYTRFLEINALAQPRNAEYREAQAFMGTTDRGGGSR
jgi:tetratricopeptide (TPR) repeat protein